MKIKLNYKNKNIFPYSIFADLSFLLIIFFIVTSIFIVHKGYPLILPGKKQKKVSVKIDKLLFFRLTENELYLNNSKIGYFKNNKIFLNDFFYQKIKDESNAKICFLYISNKLKYVYLVKFIDILRNYGFSHFAFKSQDDNIAYIDFLKWLKQQENRKNK